MYGADREVIQYRDSKVTFSVWIRSFLLASHEASAQLLWFFVSPERGPGMPVQCESS